jgi:hypothetical protein
LLGGQSSGGTSMLSSAHSGRWSEIKPAGGNVFEIGKAFTTDPAGYSLACRGVVLRDEDGLGAAAWLHFAPTV